MRLKQLLILSGGLVLIGALSIGCTLRKLSPEHPYASPSRVSKDFFVKYDAKGNIVGRKTFFAGWAPESSAGDLWGAVLNMNHASHVNVEFEVTEHFLIGKRVNPTYPNNRDRWETIIRIPITKHFYYEQDKDARGRESNNYIENDRRSDWSARPYINLDLQRAQFANWEVGAMGGSKLAAAENIEDIEWDKEKGFLGFTLQSSNWIPTYWSGTLTEQAKVRVNFLSFEHDAGFQKTPFNVRNADHLNVLHILGKQIEGDASRQDLYAAKWDTKKKTPIYLHGFPKEFEGIGRESIELWNDEFERMGHGRPFEVRISKRKYAFDLRESSIIWIDDRRISLHAPLGVSQTIADVKNGKMLWTGITVWGGTLQEYLNSYATYSTGESTTAMNKMATGVQTGLLFNKKNTMSSQTSVPEGLFFSPGVSALSEEIRKANAFHGMDEKTAARIAMQEAKNLDARLQKFQFQNLSPIALEKQKHSNFFQDLIGMPHLKDSMDQLQPDVKNQMTAFMSSGLQQESFKKLAMMLKNLSGHGSHAHPSTASIHDADLKFENMARQWTTAINTYQLDKVQATRAIVKYIVLHELGHSMGLGHNFKENILPEPGTVPNKYLQGFTDTSYKNKAGGVKRLGLYDAAKKNFTNATTVMGYPSGHTQVLLNYDDILPGPHDQVALEYIYNKRYPIYAKGSSGAEDFEFQALPPDGLIEKQLVKNGKEYRPAFFPQCNDLDASYNLDPYCNRFDRGYDAQSLVKNYFDDFDGNLLSQLTAYSNTVKGFNPEVAEAYLWMNSLDLFSRVRTFYDLMRLKYKDDFAQLMKGTPHEVTKNLQEFSEACVKASRGEPIDNTKLREVLTDPKKKELVNLCLATSTMLKRAERLMQLPGPDSTIVNYFDRTSIASIPGGEAQLRADIFGKWKDLARTPIKMSALLATTTVSPFISLSGWLIPLPMYSDSQSSFHISTFYPKEYISSIATTMRNNLSISSSTTEQNTKIGRAILALGFLLNNSYASNDSLMVPKIFLDEIRRQTRYDYSYVIVNVTPNNEKGEEIARAFTGVVQGMFSSSSEALESIYLYTQNRVVLRPPLSSLLYPVTEIRWISPTSGILFALKLNYSDQTNENLQVSNIRSDLQTLLKTAMDNCINGPGQTQNGLASFFNQNSKERFPGFDFPKTIAIKPTDKDLFKNSLDTQFRRYYNNEGGFSVAPQPEQCEAAINAQNLIVMAASALNGFYFNEIYDYMEKGQ